MPSSGLAPPPRGQQCPWQLFPAHTVPTGSDLPTWPTLARHTFPCTETPAALGAPEGMGWASLKAPATLPGDAHARGARPAMVGLSLTRPKSSRSHTLGACPRRRLTQPTAHCQPPETNPALCPRTYPNCWVPTSHWPPSIEETPLSWPHLSFQLLPLHSPGPRGVICHPPPPSTQTPTQQNPTCARRLNPQQLQLLHPTHCLKTPPRLLMYPCWAAPYPPWGPGHP